MPRTSAGFRHWSASKGIRISTQSHSPMQALARFSPDILQPFLAYSLIHSGEAIKEWLLTQQALFSNFYVINCTLKLIPPFHFQERTVVKVIQVDPYLLVNIPVILGSKLDWSVLDIFHVQQEYQWSIQN